MNLNIEWLTALQKEKKCIAEVQVLFNNLRELDFIMNQTIITKKEKRDKPLSVRLPNSAVNKLKNISDLYERSQLEVIETLINNYWNEIPEESKKMEKRLDDN